MSDKDDEMTRMLDGHITRLTEELRRPEKFHKVAEGESIHISGKRYPVTSFEVPLANRVTREINKMADQDFMKEIKANLWFNMPVLPRPYLFSPIMETDERVTPVRAERVTMTKCGCGYHMLDPTLDVYAQHREWIRGAFVRVEAPNRHAVQMASGIGISAPPPVPLVGPDMNGDDVADDLAPSEIRAWRESHGVTR